MLLLSQLDHYSASYQFIFSQFQILLFIICFVIMDSILSKHDVELVSRGMFLERDSKRKRLLVLVPSFCFLLDSAALLPEVFFPSCASAQSALASFQILPQPCDPLYHMMWAPDAATFSVCPPTVFTPLVPQMGVSFLLGNYRPALAQEIQ